MSRFGDVAVMKEVDNKFAAEEGEPFARVEYVFVEREFESNSSKEAERFIKECDEEGTYLVVRVMKELGVKTQTVTQTVVEDLNPKATGMSTEEMEAQMNEEDKVAE